MLTLYDENDFHSIQFENEHESHHLVRELMGNKSFDFVSNVNTKIIAMGYENDIWPLTINHKEYRNALICSPYTTYVIYPLDEFKRFTKVWIKVAVLLNAAIMFVLCRLTRFNQVVQVNNNLNSLIKHPKKFIQLISEITKKIIQKYPKHAVTFFRVNDALDNDLLNALKEYGYLVFPDRSAHVFLTKNGVMQRSHTKRDMSLLRKTSYEIVPHDALTIQDAERIAELYQSLFIEKHSRCNPQYTVYYFQQAIQNHWHHYTALRNTEGRIDAFISWFDKENVMTCGPLGYDSGVDRKMGLYRKLVAICLQRADQNEIIFNMGGGSDEFKSNRGSTQTLEYTAVYCKHLPFYRQISWKIVNYALNKLLRKIVNDSVF